MLNTVIGVAAILLLLGAQPAHANTQNDRTTMDVVEAQAATAIGGVGLAELSMPWAAARDPLATGRVLLAKADVKNEAPPPDPKAESSAIDQLRADFKVLKKAWDDRRDKTDGGKALVEILALIAGILGLLFTSTKTAIRYADKGKADRRTDE